MADLTPHQQKIVKRYYDNLDTIKLSRLAELVGELYLSEGKKRERVWKQLITTMEALEVHPARIEHLRKQDNPALLADLVKELERAK